MVEFGDPVGQGTAACRHAEYRRGDEEEGYQRILSVSPRDARLCLRIERLVMIARVGAVIAPGLAMFCKNFYPGSSLPSLPRKAIVEFWRIFLREKEAWGQLSLETPFLLAGKKAPIQ
jgi:hypothetical protein